MAEVKLHGMSMSPFSYRPVWALALKGISYEYIEEDLTNKSQLLLQYNPVHKKIPVLVHGGKPICESMVIVEYIDETWPENPLFPTDPFERAQARFWIKFSEDKSPAIWSFFAIKGEEEREKAKRESVELLRIVEDEALGDNKFFGGQGIGAVDLAFGWIAGWLVVIEEAVVAGEEKLLDPAAFTRLHAWAERFREAAAIRDNLPDRDELAAHAARRREERLRSEAI